jgi:hypothetical protein
MRSVLGAFVMLTGSWAVPLAHALDRTAPTEDARIESEGPGRSSVRIEWAGGSAGAKVRLQLSADPEFDQLVIDRELPCCDARLRNLEAGRYHWRILDAAADAEQCRSSFEIVGRPHQE